MTNQLLTLNEVQALLTQGKSMVLAGDEALLRKLPRGSWIAGTIPYFMDVAGGTMSQERIFATEMPPEVLATSIRVYANGDLPGIYRDLPDNGFGIAIIPASSVAHLAFATDCSSYPGFAERPLAGWISGVHLDDLGKVTPKIISGQDGQLLEDGAVVMQATLPPSHYIELDIVNIFERGSGDSIEFESTGFSVESALVNGVKRNFAEYVVGSKLDTRLPLIADYCGAMINISFQSVDADKGAVQFYAPVFGGVEYRQAAPVADYAAKFGACIPASSGTQNLFACNCILNYLFGELDGKRTGAVTGPITFGEIAYQLVNQTMVRMTLGSC